MKATLFCIWLVLLLHACDTKKEQPMNRNETVTDTAPAMKSGTAAVNGINMYYEIYGAGSPLVLIHGGGSTIHTSFGRVIPALAKNRQVIALELQAHGRTSDRDQPETFEQDADDVAALLHELKISKADFFGFSNGGTTTMRIATRHPELVGKIIVGSAIYKRSGMPAGFWEAINQVTLKDMPQQLSDAYLEVTPDSTGLNRMFEKDRNRMIGFTDWNASDLQAIKAPTLIICGDQDVVLPEHAVEMHRLIAGSRLVILPGLHGAYMGEITTVKNDSVKSYYVTTLIDEFLNRKTRE